MYEKKKGQPYYTNRHSCFLLQYHMVLVTKYRHPVLTGGVRDVVYGTIRDIFAVKGLVILEMNGEPDHVHILYEADPFTAPGEPREHREDEDLPVRQEGVRGNGAQEILLETVFLVRQLFRNDGQREFPYNGPGIYPGPVSLIRHSPTPLRCGSSYGRGTLLLRFIEMDL